MSNLHPDDFDFSSLKLECDDDEILSDISNFRFSKVNKFNQIIGSSPPISNDGTQIASTFKAKPAATCQLSSPSRSTKWDLPLSFEEYQGQIISPTLSQARMGSPVRSDLGVTLESLILRQPASSASSFPSNGSLGKNDLSIFTGSMDMGYQATLAGKSASFPLPQVSSNPQVEIELLKRQLELANKKIDQIQTQFGQSASDNYDLGLPKRFRDSPVVWNDNTTPKLEPGDLKDSFHDNYTSGNQILRSFSPGTYQASANIWNSSQPDPTKTKSRVDKWYNTVGNQTGGNPGIYSIKPSTSDTVFPEQDFWQGLDFTNQSIYESNFRSGGFTPKPNPPDSETIDGVFSQDVSMVSLLSYP